MRIAVITCEAYSDAWEPFRSLFYEYWPECPYSLNFHSEQYPGESWLSVVARCAKESDEPVLMMQEDFFLTTPVQQDLVAHGLRLLTEHDAGCVRLYPGPGANEKCGDDPYFGLVRPGTVNRISCQAAIWDPEYLYDITANSTSTTSEAGDFENTGTPYSDTKPEPVLAFKRDVRPWPMEYLCTAILRGLWNPGAIKLCEQHGIEIDRSRRAVAV